MKALKLSIIALFISSVTFAQSVETKKAVQAEVSVPAANSLIKWENETVESEDQ